MKRKERRGNERKGEERRGGQVREMREVDVLRIGDKRKMRAREKMMECCSSDDQSGVVLMPHATPHSVMAVID